jgi:hypothetical protein
MERSREATRRFEKAKKYLRFFLRDTPELNRLIRAEESDDGMLEFAIDMAIDDWNFTTPMLRPYTIEDFPSIFMLMHGAVIQVLKAQGLYQARNELTYQAGGSSIVRSNKSGIYQSWLINFSNEYELKKRNIKIQQNIEGGWGGVASEYSNIGYTW